MDWKMWAERGRVAYDKYKQGKKVYKSGKKATDYLKLARGAFDEDTRSGSLLKLGIKASLDVGSKLLGSSLTSHPYFTYHKVHIEALAAAVNVSDVKANAEAALENAIKASDSSQHLAGQMSSYESRRKMLADRFAILNFLLLGALKDLKNNTPGVADEIRRAGNTQAGLQSEADKAIYDYRCCWAGLTDEVLQLLLMVKTDYAATSTAMARYEQKKKKLESGRGFEGHLGRIASYRIEERRMLTALTERPSRERTIMDPIGPARKAFEDVSRCTSIICRSNDAVFDDRMVFDEPQKLIVILCNNAR